MLDSTLEQLERLVTELLQQNQQLSSDNQQLRASLAKASEDNDALQLQVLEQEEQQGHAASRLQALVQRVNDVRAQA
jgi:regulator of replication initiation timing